MADELTQQEPTADEMISAVEGGESQDKQEQMVTYTANGAERTEPLSLALKRASQGYNYAQLVADLKAQTTAVQDRETKVAESEQRWKPFDDYAKENPEWHNHWEQAYNNRQSFDGTGNDQNLQPVMSEINNLKEQFGEVKEFIQTAQKSQEDQKYWDEIKAVQKEFPKLDLNQADENGESLEYRILRHAKDNNIGSFRVAFRDYYWDKARDIQSQNAKADVTQSIQDQRKRGIIGVTDSPTQVRQMPDLRSMTDAEIEEAALAYADQLTSD